MYFNLRACGVCCRSQKAAEEEERYAKHATPFASRSPLAPTVRLFCLYLFCAFLYHCLPLLLLPPILLLLLPLLLLLMFNKLLKTGDLLLLFLPWLIKLLFFTAWPRRNVGFDYRSSLSYLLRSCFSLSLNLLIWPIWSFVPVLFLHLFFTIPEKCCCFHLRLPASFSSLALFLILVLSLFSFLAPSLWWHWSLFVSVSVSIFAER